MNSTMKKALALGLIVLSTVISSLLLTGCGKNAEAPETTLPALQTQTREEQEVTEAPTFPTVEALPTEIRSDRLNIQIISASPSGLDICYQILKDPETAQTNQCGSYTLEKKSGDSWEALTGKPSGKFFPNAPVAPVGDADYWHDSFADFGRLYGPLTPGVYRIHWNLLHNQEPEVFEFSISAPQKPEEAQALDRILNGIRELDDQQTRNLKQTNSQAGEPNSYTQYLRWGDSKMYVFYHMEGGEPVPFHGGMIHNGINYLLMHEDPNTSDSPVRGWEPVELLPPGIAIDGWLPFLPDFSQAQFTEISPEKIVLHVDGESTSSRTDAPIPYQELTFEFNPDGSLFRYGSCSVNYSQTGPDSDFDEVKYHSLVEILDTDQVPQFFEGTKAADARPFSWAEDQKNMKAENVSFHNTDPQPVTDAAQALERAKAECTVDYDGTMVYHDKDAKMWKVEFQQLSGYAGYQYIYMDENGVTQMVALGSPKEQWYPEP